MSEGSDEPGELAEQLNWAWEGSSEDQASARESHSSSSEDQDEHEIPIRDSRGRVSPPVDPRVELEEEQAAEVNPVAT